MFTKSILSFALVVAALTFSPQESDLTGIKCILNGKKAASKDAAVDYKKAKVYFCCEHCADTFKKDTFDEGMKLKEKAKFTTKANHQLVLTSQFVQKACPISGRPVDETKVVKVAGAKVGMCCGGCVKKIEGLEKLEDKVNLVFTEEAFKKGFKLKEPEIDLANVKCMMMPKKAVSADHAVEYKDGKVFFCCGGCAKKFAKAKSLAKDDPAFAVKANHQLVATGQYKQTGCPISGGGVDDDQVSEVGGVSVKFCCDKCKGKVDSAEDDMKVELVFGKRFDKAFSKN